MSNNRSDLDSYYKLLSLIKNITCHLENDLNDESASINNIISNIETFQKQHILLKLSYKNIISLRLSLNIIFDYLWSLYEIDNPDLNIFLKTYFEKPLLLPNKHILEHNCYKYIFASLYLQLEKIPII